MEQLQALALMFLKLNSQAFNAFLVFFGFYCVLIGYLIFRSTFLPRIVGVLMAFAGLGLPDPSVSAARKLSVPLQSGPAALGEGSLMLWLLIVGMNVQRWKEQASAAEERQ